MSKFLWMSARPKRYSPGSCVRTYFWAYVAASSDYSRKSIDVRMVFAFIRTIEIGIKMIVRINLPLFMYTPQSSISLAPAALLMSVPKAELNP